jgi:hypothetical protein
MGTLLFDEDIAARYKVTVRKAREMMLAMPTINLGTDRRKRLAVQEETLSAWEQSRTEIRGAYEPKGQRPRLRVAKRAPAAVPYKDGHPICPKRKDGRT